MLEPFVITFNLKFLAQEPVYFYPSLLYLFLYWFPARTEHELATWVTLSTFSLQSLNRGDTYWQSMPFFAAFGLGACSWAAHIRVSVSCFNSAAFSHWHLLWPCITLFLSGIDHAMFSFCMLLVFHSFVLLYSSHQSLLLVEASSCSLQKSLVVICNIIKENRSFQFNTVFDTQQPYTSLNIYSPSTEERGCKPTSVYIPEFLCLLVNFIQLSLILVDYSGPYQIVVSAHILIAFMTFPPFCWF